MERRAQKLSFSIMSILEHQTQSKERTFPGAELNMEEDSQQPQSPSKGPTCVADIPESPECLDSKMETKFAKSNKLLVKAEYEKRPIRVRFTPLQIQALEKQFQKQHYLLPAERKFLATSLDMTEQQVKTWFQNKRAQHKRTRPLTRSPAYYQLRPVVPFPPLLPPSIGCSNGLLQLPFAFPTIPAIHTSHTLTSSPSPPALSPHFPMPMACIPVPITQS